MLVMMMSTATITKTSSSVSSSSLSSSTALEAVPAMTDITELKSSELAEKSINRNNNNNNNNKQIPEPEDNSAEQLLNEWLGELDTLTGSLDNGSNSTSQLAATANTKTLQTTGASLSNELLLSTPRMDSYRYSMANLEDSQDVDLDAILGELCALENQCDQEIGRVTNQTNFKDELMVKKQVHQLPPPPPPLHHNHHHNHNHHQHQQQQQQQQSIMQHHHYRSCSDGTRPLISSDEINDLLKVRSTNGIRTESPDNDSAFSDTVSMLSTESSSASSTGFTNTKLLLLNSSTNFKDHHHHQQQQQQQNRDKAEKIRLALEKMKEAAIKKLFIKVFMADGSTKSLLVDEKMSTGSVTRLLADKNHVRMDPKWAIIENIPELFMERIYEDHEMLVDNLMQWSRDSKNKIIFCARNEKMQMFERPELFLLSASEDYDQQTSTAAATVSLLLPANNTESSRHFDFDENSRQVLLNDFFSLNSNNVPEVEGPLYLKSDSKKGWKKYYFVLRASGIYYCTKEKSKSNAARDLTCLTKFEMSQAYYGIGWKKKLKAPTDHCFAIKDQRLNEPKSFKYIKYLCAENGLALQRWMTGIRIAKHGRKLLDNYRVLVDELAHEDIDLLANARSCSISSIAITTNHQQQQQQQQQHQQQQPHHHHHHRNSLTPLTGNSSMISYSSSGRHSRASSSSSSGCVSDSIGSESGFEADFPMGTIKRKPSMKPCLPLTNGTRQLIEAGQIGDGTGDGDGDDSFAMPTKNLHQTHHNHNYVTNTGTLTRKHNRRKSNETDDSSSSNSSTLKRRFPLRSSQSVQSSSVSGNSTPIVQTPTKDDEIDFRFEDHMKSSVSLDSLPPPPEPCDLPTLSESQLNLSGSQISLMSLPPPPSPLSESGDDDAIATAAAAASASSGNESAAEDGQETGTVKRRPKSIPIQNSVNKESSTLAVLIPEAPKLTKNCLRSSLRCHNNSNSLMTTAAAIIANPRKVSFQSDQKTYESESGGGGGGSSLYGGSRKSENNNNAHHLIAGTAPKKPEPPKRSENTKLTMSPKRFENSVSAPPKEFIRDLQKVMKKKWQIAQKCQLNQLDTPYEVLGFRDPPSFYYDAYYKETNVSNWVQEHYGNVTDSAGTVYENVGQPQQQQLQPPHLKLQPQPTFPNFYPCSKTMNGSNGGGGGGSSSISTTSSTKRLPPPLPKRSETTHLTTPKF